MKRVIVTVAALAAGTVLAGENPLVEMFGDEVSFFENCETQKTSVAGGLFGKCLDRGGFGRRIVAPSEVFDTSRPGTMLCWLRLKPDTDLAVFNRKEPGFTCFEAMFTGPQHQLLGSKQSALGWGGGVVNVFHAETGADKRMRIGGASTPAAIRNWGVGTWHLFAISWSPERIGVSFDGASWSTSILSAPMKRFDGWIKWSVPESPKGAKESVFEMDECALLNCVPEEQELQAYYKAALARAAGKDVKIEAAAKKSGLASRIAFKFAYYPYHDKIHAEVSLGSLPDPKAVRLEVRTAKGEVVAEKEFAPDAAHVVDAVWPIPDLAPLTKKSGSPDYTIAMIPQGIADATIEKTFKRDVFEWERNMIGLSDTVPAPFERVRREKVGGESRSTVDGAAGCRTYVGEASCLPTELEKISVVLRDHIVDKKTGFWQQVVAQGKPLLARPMRIVEIKKVGRESRSTEDGKFHCSPSPSTFTFSSLWDCDGMMEWKLTLAPGHYEPMSLEIPIRAERAKLMHTCMDSLRANYAGEVPAGEGVVWTSAQAPGRHGILGDFVPYIWIGGPLRGIAVFGDNDKGWVLGGEQKVGGESRSTEEGKVPLSTSTSSLLSCSCPCQEILREADGTVVLRLNLIQHAVDLTEPQTIHLGFQATPVKPMRDDWRAWDTGNLLGCCLYWGGYEDSHAVCPYDGTDAFWKKMGEARRTGKSDPDFMKAYCAGYDPGVDKSSPVYTQRLHRASVHFHAGMHVASAYGKERRPLVWYTNGRGVHYGTKEGQTFCDEWSRGAWFTRKFTIRSMAAYELDPCRSYLDYAAWWWKKAFDAGALDRLYWDDVYLSLCSDPVGTDAYRWPSGLVQGSCGIFNMRAQVRRGAVVAAECGKDPTGNWIHMTNTAMAPVSAFAGVHYDWEDPHFGNTFQERYSRAYCQACAIGRQMGNKVGVMGYFTTAKKEDLPRLRRQSAGVTLTHELGWWKPEAVRKALADFGYGVKGSGVKVWNYWDEDVPFPVEITGLEWSALAMARKAVRSSEVKVQSSEFKVQSSELGVQSSKFRVQSSEAEVLIIVCNYENRAATARVKPDCSVLGLKPDFKAVNAETSAPLAVTGGAVEVSLAPYDFVVIRVD